MDNVHTLIYELSAILDMSNTHHINCGDIVIVHFENGSDPRMVKVQTADKSPFVQLKSAISHNFIMQYARVPLEAHCFECDTSIPYPNENRLAPTKVSCEKCGSDCVLHETPKAVPSYPMKCDNCGETDMVDMAPNGKFCMESFWSFENSKCEKCEKFTMNPVTEGSTTPSTPMEVLN